MRFPFVGQAYQARSLNIDAQRTVNLYLEMDETGKEPVSLYGCPGTVRLATIGSGPIRGQCTAGAYDYVVSGNEVYKVTSSYSATLLGTIGTSSGPVSMQENGTYLLIVDGTSGYTVTLSTDAFAQVTDPDFPSNPVSVASIDSYFIVIDGNTQLFFLSPDGVNWDGADFATAEGSPDKLVSCLADHRELWLFGQSTIEVWADTGNVDFPFERIQGAFIETGCAAPYSVAKADNSIFWLMADERGNGMVYRAQGYIGQRISTHAIEKAIQGYSTISDAIAYTYQQEGHTFYVLTFPTGNATWVYDVATNAWHERAYMDPDTGALGRHRSNCYVFFNGKPTVGDYEDGRLYEFDLDTYTDDGDYIKALRSCAHITDKKDLNRVVHHRLQVDIEAGVGLVTGQGSDPQMVLDWSNDGGHTWSNEHTVSMGAIGKYNARAIWRRLGSARDRVYRVSITDPVKRVIIGANLQAEGTSA
jgi:hypothetical protein